MQINQQNFKINNQIPEIKIETEISLLEGVSKEVMDHLKKQFLSLVYYNTCRNLNNVEIKRWEKSDLKETLTPNNFEKVTNLVKQFREHTANYPTQPGGIPIDLQTVRLKGQEKCHFAGEKCTEFGFTGDNGQDFCILENKISDVLPNTTQKYGYHELSIDQLNPKLIYTLKLASCIGILMVGIGKDGQAKKAALMHEDYGSPENSVTDMFNNSFKDEVKNFSKINLFLIGGNGGEELTTKRFNIHKSEISQLSEQYNNLINLCFSSDSLNSTSDQFMWYQSNVFLSSIESSTYLWTINANPSPKLNLEAVCVAGPELAYEKLDAYYTKNIPPLMGF